MISARSRIRSHRAATTGSTGFITLLLHPPGEGHPKPRLNTGDRLGMYFSYFDLRDGPEFLTPAQLPLFVSTFFVYPGNTGNTPLHLAMESAHAEAAALLVEAGADRSRVSISSLSLELYLIVYAFVPFTRTFFHSTARVFFVAPCADES